MPGGTSLLTFGFAQSHAPNGAWREPSNLGYIVLSEHKAIVSHESHSGEGIIE